MNALTVGELAAILTELRAARTELQEVRRLLAGCVAALGVEPEPADPVAAGYQHFRQRVRQREGRA